MSEAGADEAGPALTLLQREATFLASQLHKAKLHSRSMLGVTLGLLFEDALMSVVNSYMLWHGKDYPEFRERSLYALLALACVSSLASLGYKFGDVGSWLVGTRSANRAMHARAQRIKALLAPGADRTWDESIADRLAPRRLQRSKSYIRPSVSSASLLQRLSVAV